MNKRQFISEKLDNLCRYIASELGRDNKLYKIFKAYSTTDFDKFLFTITQLKASFPNGLSSKDVKTQLVKWKIDVTLKEEHLTKINRYFKCFSSVI